MYKRQDKYFKDIEDYPFDPIYTNIFANDGTEIRIHHIDEGPSDGPILLAMHGQPVWSYLYSKMIPILNDSGIRVIAPDLVGYGKSDKPASRNDYSYQNQVDWMNQWLVKNNLNDLIFFGHDQKILNHLNYFLLAIDSSNQPDSDNYNHFLMLVCLTYHIQLNRVQLLLFQNH